MSHEALGEQFEGVPLFHGSNERFRRYAHVRPASKVGRQPQWEEGSPSHAYATLDPEHAAHFGRYIYQVQPMKFKDVEWDPHSGSLGGVRSKAGFEVVKDDWPDE